MNYSSSSSLGFWILRNLHALAWVCGSPDFFMHQDILMDLLYSLSLNYFIFLLAYLFLSSFFFFLFFFSPEMTYKIFFLSIFFKILVFSDKNHHFKFINLKISLHNNNFCPLMPVCHSLRQSSGTLLLFGWTQEYNTMHELYSQVQQKAVFAISSLKV